MNPQSIQLRLNELQLKINKIDELIFTKTNIINNNWLELSNSNIKQFSITRFIYNFITL